MTHSDDIGSENARKFESCGQQAVEPQQSFRLIGQPTYTIRWTACRRYPAIIRPGGAGFMKRSPERPIPEPQLRLSAPSPGVPDGLYHAPIVQMPQLYRSSRPLGSNPQAPRPPIWQYLPVCGRADRSSHSNCARQHRAAMRDNRASPASLLGPTRELDGAFSAAPLSRAPPFRPCRQVQDVAPFSPREKGTTTTSSSWSFRNPG